MKNNEKITIECLSCKRTQTLRKSKVIKADYYTCSLGICKINPDFIFPKLRDGYVRVIEMNASGSFSGVTDRISTKEEKVSIDRAREIKYASMIFIKEKSQKAEYN